MTNEESKGLRETPEVAVPEVAASPLPDADVATTLFEAPMTVAREVMQRRRGVLRELAK
jgi:hypothetical protein